MLNAFCLFFFYLFLACNSSSDSNLSYAQSLFEQGRLASEQQLYQQALKFFQLAREKSPNITHLTHFESGNIYALLGQSDLASQEYELALTADPHHNESRHNLALSLIHISEPTRP